jgi:signal transduction histidine kinase
MEMAHHRVRRKIENNFDAFLTLAALLFGVLTSLPFGQGHARSPWELILAVAAWLPLLGRNRWPLPVAALAAALDAIHIAVAAHGTPSSSIVPAATMLGLYTVALRLSARTAWSAAAIAGIAQAVVAMATSSDLSADALYINWALVATALGRLVSERRARIQAAEQRAAEAEATKAAEARRQVTAERIRIAHELHDVLAHHIAVVNAQAGVAQYLLRDNPDAAQKALAGIAENTQAALDELRVTLGILRDEQQPADSDGHNDERRPTPGAEELPQLFATFTSAGMHLTTHVAGTARTLPTAANLALYRITQEALTNASKHAPGSDVTVDIDWTEKSVTLTVANTPPASPLSKGSGTGNGLLGMRERAVAADGTLHADPTRDGGYRLVATLRAPASTPGTGTAAATEEPS